MFGGKILFLDRDDINTDEIIPAKYLTEVYKKELAPHLFEDLKLDGFSVEHIRGTGAVITRSNFGCGSSREHAPWALQVNEIRTVIASGFARIFRQNMFNCGLVPVQLSSDQVDEIFNTFSDRECTAEVDVDECEIRLSDGNESASYGFVLSDFHRDVIKSGGWVEYASLKY